eukprot:184500-Pleurochrysis_carterae.AAC.2
MELDAAASHFDADALVVKLLNEPVVRVDAQGVWKKNLGIACSKRRLLERAAASSQKIGSEVKDLQKRLREIERRLTTTVAEQGRRAENRAAKAKHYRDGKELDAARQEPNDTKAHLKATNLKWQEAAKRARGLAQKLITRDRQQQVHASGEGGEAGQLVKVSKMYAELKIMNAELKKELKKAKEAAEANAAAAREAGGSSAEGGGEVEGDVESLADESETLRTRTPSVAKRLSKKAGLQSGCEKPAAKRRWGNRVKQHVSCAVKGRCEDADGARLITKALCSGIGAEGIERLRQTPKFVKNDKQMVQSTLEKGRGALDGAPVRPRLGSSGAEP